MEEQKYPQKIVG